MLETFAMLMVMSFFWSAIYIAGAVWTWLHEDDPDEDAPRSDTLDDSVRANGYDDDKENPDAA